MKVVNVAIISPIPLLRTYAMMSTNYHLLLSNLFGDFRYLDFYRERGEHGDFLILDNSAHELGHGESFDLLRRKIESVPVNEVVVPDRLFFGEDTVDNATEFIPTFRSRFGNEIRLMGVPQGRTLKEWRNCCYHLLKLGVDTIGISKDYEVWDGGLIRLLECVETDVLNLGLDREIPVHMLGWGRDLHQLKEFSDWNLSALGSPVYIRGVDSAKPLVFAEAGISLEPLLTGREEIKYPKRQLDFFNLTHIDENLAEININVMKRIAQGL